MSDKKDKSGVVKPTNPAGRLTLPPIVDNPNPAPPPPSPQPQPPVPVEQGAGTELEATLGDMPRGLGDTPRVLGDMPRGDDQGIRERFSQLLGDRDDNLLGKRGKRPRDESDQFNLNARIFLQDAVRLAAREAGVGPGAMLDLLLELALRQVAPDEIAKAYARRCEINRVPNDWQP